MKINPFLTNEPIKHYVTGRGLCAHLRRGFEEHEYNPKLPLEICKCFVCKPVKKFEYNPAFKKFQEVIRN